MIFGTEFKEYFGVLAGRAHKRQIWPTSTNGMMSGVGRRVALSFALLGVVTLLVTTGIAQTGTDPRNTSDEYFDAVNGANCYAHHSGDNFEAMHFALLTRYSQLPIGETTELELQVRHAGEMTQDLLDIGVTIDTAQARNVQVVTDDFVANVENEVHPDIAPGATESIPVEVLNGAQAFNVNATAPPGVLPNEEIMLRVVSQTGTAFTGSGDAFSKRVSLDAETLSGAGSGPYTVEVRYAHPAPQAGSPLTVEIQYEVIYAQTQTKFFFEADGGAIRGSDPGNLKSRIIKIPIIVTSDAEGLLDFRAEGVNFWEHQPGDGAPLDNGLFYRFATMKVKGGDTEIRVESAGPIPLAPTVDLYNMFTRVLGYIAIVLVPVSMITGGMFGKGSRRYLNKITGGAKKRVLWHNAMSFMIIGIASLHFLLALLEGKFLWTKGLFWGGVGWAVLVSLGFTGWYQVRMIKRWNYKVWRHTHLWSAVGVFGFAVIHMLLEGSDFAVVRDLLPDWHVKLVWP